MIRSENKRGKENSGCCCLPTKKEKKEVNMVTAHGTHWGISLMWWSPQLIWGAVALAPGAFTSLPVEALTLIVWPVVHRDLLAFCNIYEWVIMWLKYYQFHSSIIKVQLFLNPLIQHCIHIMNNSALAIE